MFDNVTPVSDYEHSLKLRHFLQENQTLSRVLSTSGKKRVSLRTPFLKWTEQYPYSAFFSLSHSAFFSLKHSAFFSLSHSAFFSQASFFSGSCIIVPANAGADSPIAKTIKQAMANFFFITILFKRLIDSIQT